MSVQGPARRTIRKVSFLVDARERALLEEAGFSHTTSPAHQWLPPKPVGTEQLSLSVAHA